MFKIGDRVNMRDGSWSFGIYNDEYCHHVPNKPEIRQNLLVIKTNLTVMEEADGDRTGHYSEVCDLLVTDENSGFWFTRSDLCNPVDKKIEVRYFSDGKDITNEISDETKQNLRSVAR